MIEKIDDLHTHSIHSDGSDTPEELIQLAVKKNITNFALTDHDNIEGSKELIRLTNYGINIYSGVELTIKYIQGRMHLLGYNIDLYDEELNKVLKEIKEISIYNVLLYLQCLKNDYGIVFPQQEIDNLVNSKGNIGRPQIALLLLKYSYCKTVDEAFDNYLRSIYEKVRKVKRGITLEEGINLIHKAGGVAVLAHPNSILYSYKEFSDILPKFIDIGLDGLETKHYKLNIDEQKFYHNQALKYNLLESGGTDYHGIQIKPDVELGTGKNNNVNIPENTLSLTKRIKSRYII